MKLMIASDLHGSAYYCRHLIDAYKEEKADKLLLLGDLLYHGPRNELPKEYNTKAVFEMLNTVKNEIICVRGNCDSEVDQMVLAFPMMAEYALLEVNGRTIFATHGHIYHPDNPPMLKQGDILLNGHTHVPAWEEKKNFIYANPGSLSLPKENTWAGYMMIEEQVLWKDFEGNIRKQV